MSATDKPLTAAEIPGPRARPRGAADSDLIALYAKALREALAAAKLAAAQDAEIANLHGRLEAVLFLASQQAKEIAALRPRAEQSPRSSRIVAHYKDTFSKFHADGSMTTWRGPRVQVLQEGQHASAEAKDDELVVLRARAERAEADAGRYRWLRDVGRMEFGWQGQPRERSWWCVEYTGGQADARIDAAIAASLPTWKPDSPNLWRTAELPAASQPKPEPDALCSCKERPAADCPGEWEPGCDLGNNEKYVVASAAKSIKPEGAGDA